VTDEMSGPFLEDLHWVDHSTLDAISAIARRREPARLLMIGTYRPVNVILGDSPFKDLRRDLCMHGGRTTSMAYRGTKKTIGDIGNDLGADYLVEGSVRAAAGRVRVSITLNRVRDQVQIWTESYERDAGDLLGLQSALGQDIAEQIHLRLSSPERADSAPRRQTLHQRCVRSVPSRTLLLQPNNPSNDRAGASLLSAND
jgi:hypothetical protein